jgi:central glycolytic genes regulator
MGERIVRSEVNFLKNQGLVEINTMGMNVTVEGETIIDTLKGFIHELKGLSNLEVIINSLSSMLPSLFASQVANSILLFS